MAKFISQIDANLEDVYSWHQNFGASDRLCPPWSNAELLRQEQSTDETIKFVKTTAGILQEKVKVNNRAKSIVSEKSISNKKKWHHVKDFDASSNKTVIKETISYNLLHSILPDFMVEKSINNRLEKEFNFRKHRIENDIKQHQLFPYQKRQNIAIFGAENNLGKQLRSFFNSGQHNVYSFVTRKPYPTAREIHLSTKTGAVDLPILKDVDSVIFFAINDKTKLTDSNFDKHLDEKLKQISLLTKSFQLNNKFPESITVISSTCLYNTRNNKSSDLSATEKSSKMNLYYLSIEQAFDTLKRQGVRIIYSRMGNVISAREGILKQTINQQKSTFLKHSEDTSKFINWVSIDDAIYATNHILFNNRLSGAINVCSSMTIKQEDLSILVGSKINRHILFTIPKFLFRLFNGFIRSDEVLQSTASFPKKLKDSGFKFTFENIDDTLNWETGHFYNKKEYTW